MGYAVYHTEKGSGGSAAIGNHIDRTKGKEHTFKNADPELINKNLHMAPAKYQEVGLSEAIKIRMEEGYGVKNDEGVLVKKGIRKDAVKYFKHVLTGSHDEMIALAKDPKEFEAWIKDNHKFIAQEFGEQNIVRFTVHLDEKTPHIHVITVPLTTDGRLSAKDIIGNPAAMSKRQDRYAEAMQPYGLERGIKLTGIRHETAKEYYGRISVVDKEIISKMDKVEAIFSENKIGVLSIKSDTANLRAKISGFIQNEGIVKGIDLLAQNTALKRELKHIQAGSTYANLALKKFTTKKDMVLVGYFAKLVKEKKLSFQRKDPFNGNYYFLKAGEKDINKMIVVKSDEGVWTQKSENKQGDLVGAIRDFEKKGFSEAAMILSQGEESFLKSYFKFTENIETKASERAVAAEVIRKNIEMDIKNDVPIQKISTKEDVALVGYFAKLVSEKKLSFLHKDPFNGNYYFLKAGEKDINKIIIVKSAEGIWTQKSENKQGYLVGAVQDFEKKGFAEAAMILSQGEELFVKSYFKLTENIEMDIENDDVSIQKISTKENVALVGYFVKLVSEGKLSFLHKDPFNSNYYFLKAGEKDIDKMIVVESAEGVWTQKSENKQGDLIGAIQDFEKKGFTEAAIILGEGEESFIKSYFKLTENIEIDIENDDVKRKIRR